MRRSVLESGLSVCVCAQLPEAVHLQPSYQTERRKLLEWASTPEVFCTDISGAKQLVLHAAG